MTQWSCSRTLLRYSYRTVLTILCKGAFGFELRDRRRITGVLVAIDYGGHGMVLSAQGFRQKRLAAAQVAFSRQKFRYRWPLPPQGQLFKFCTGTLGL
jgi:hypothetical protein